MKHFIWKLRYAFCMWRVVKGHNMNYSAWAYSLDSADIALGELLKDMLPTENLFEDYEPEEMAQEEMSCWGD